MGHGFAACVVTASLLMAAGGASAQTLPPFTNLPAPKAAPATIPPGVSVGTEGYTPAAPPALRSGAGATVAIMGDLSPAIPGSDKYLEAAVSQLNLLRPDMVFTVGGLIGGPTRNGNRYAEEAVRLRQSLEALKMPWYVAAGTSEMVSGVRAGEVIDRRFEKLYQTYFGPRYYSVNAGDVHAVILDSEETREGVISDAQLRWLREDLNRTFEGRGVATRAQWVIVLVHRPLWRKEGSNWGRVQDLLLEFNRKPIVSLEGMGRAPAANAGGTPRGPRVAGVFAGAERAYSLEPAMDGIRYYVLGPTAAMPRLGQDVRETLRHITLVKFDAAGGSSPPDMHVSLLQLSPPAGTSALLPEDAVTFAERRVVDAMAAWGDDVIGVDGMMDQRGNVVGKKPRLSLNNPLPDELNLQFRLAGLPYIQSPARREISNTGAEGFDLPWEMNSRHMIRYMVAGKQEGWDLGFARPEGYDPGADSGPPQLEVAAHWSDARGNVHEVILKRRITVVPHVQTQVSPTPLRLGDEQTWSKAIGGSLHAWQIRGDEPRKVKPTWQLAADEEQIYLRVRVDDPIHSYWPDLKLEPQYDSGGAGLASDAVSISWVTGPEGRETVKRIWVLPFGVVPTTRPAPALVLANEGTGAKQTPLARTDVLARTQAYVTSDGDGYEVQISLPRKLVESDQPLPVPMASTQPSRPVLGVVQMNIAVHDNDEGLRTWTRSWAREEAGPQAYAKVQIAGPVPPTATAPANPLDQLLPLLPFLPKFP